MFDDVFTVRDVRERLGLEKDAYKAKINKDFASDDYTIDSKDVVSFSRKAAQ